MLEAWTKAMVEAARTLRTRGATRVAAVGIGSGGPYAQAAAKALVEKTTLSPKEIVDSSLRIAGEICIYTNTNVRVETL